MKNSENLRLRQFEATYMANIRVMEKPTHILILPFKIVPIPKTIVITITLEYFYASI